MFTSNDPDDILDVLIEFFEEHDVDIDYLILEELAEHISLITE